ncbi:MAG: hypothetical protein AAGF71_01025 [Pseudomonadota bacterium]
MVSIEDIKDQDSLKAWLRSLPEDGQYQAAVTIACRAALRVQPYLWARLAPTRPDADLTSIVFVRASITSAVARNCSTADLKWASLFSAGAAADAAYASVDAHAADAAVAAYAAYSADADAARAAAARAAYAATATAATTTTVAAADAAVWTEIRTDCQDILNGTNPFARPLWSEQNRFTEDWSETRPQWHHAGLPWTYFADVYDAMFHGREVDWSTLEKVVLIPDEHWKDDDAPNGETAETKLARDIGALLKRRETELETALLVTDSGEDVQLSAEPTPQFYLSDRPVSDTSVLDDSLWRVRQLLDELDALTGNNDSFYLIRRQLNTLKSCCQTCTGNPFKAYDQIAPSLKRLSEKIPELELPKAETEVVEDLERALREVSVDLLAEYDDLRRRVAQRALAALKQNPQDVLAQFEAAVVVIAGLSRDDMARALEANLAVLSDPDATDDEKTDSLYELMGRLLRASRKGLEEFNKIAEQLRKAKDAIEGASPGLQEIMQQVLDVVSMLGG